MGEGVESSTFAQTLSASPPWQGRWKALLVYSQPPAMCASLILVSAVPTVF